MGCLYEPIHSVTRAHWFGTSKIKYYVGRVLSQVDYTTNLCAQKRMSNDILHTELGVIIVLDTRAAQKAALAAQEALY